MASLDDLIAQVSETRVREQLKREWAEVRKTRQFGLVFDRHLPELVPLPKVTPRRGDLVAKKGQSLTERWRVRRVRDGVAECIRPEGTADAGARFDWPLAELVVVRQFGEPIFPSLTPIDQVQNGPADAPWHGLIEADNYHALQLLGYLYAGQVDCIYIDPPYNTGARDWKYNNDYVDKNDAWRHSKWLSFMEKRLQLARRLLNPSAAVLIITIDEKEYTHLGLLLEDVFKGCKLQMVSTLINPAGVAREGGFARSDEYIFFVTLGDSAPQRLRLKRDWVSAKGRTHTGNIRWDLLRRSGTNTTRSHSPGCFFPIYVDPDVPKVELVGDALPAGISLPEPINGLVPVLPIRKDGSEGVWQWSAMTFRERLLQGRVRITGSRERGFVISILKDGEYAKIQRGEFQEIGRGPDGSIIVDSIDTDFVRAVPASQWRISSHDATQYGSRFLAEIIPDLKFPFPKSIYAVHDCIRFFVADRPNAIILDFFCGSGTTLNAVNLLNATDGGQRRCILVTNNEVSGDEAEAMRARGLQPGDETWEAQGICRSVTWPRSQFTIRGQRDDGTPLPGDYLTGGTVERERPRRIVHIGFVDPVALNTAASKKQLVALLPGLPQTLATEEAAFIVSEDHATSVLFNEMAAADWLDALDGQEQITDLFVVATTKKAFNQIKTQVQALLGPLRITEEEKRPLSEGFAANLAYFRLDFLDQHRVALKRAFREILPLLWLKAGAIGPRPELPTEAPDPDFFAPPENPFAVLLDEGAMQPLLGCERK